MASSLLSTLVVSLLLLASLTYQPSASVATTRVVVVVVGASPQVLHISTISAAPAVLPASPESSPLIPLPPALSPDEEPLLPSPGGSQSPSESTLPIIPSSPSPPNPDNVMAPQAEVALAPTSSLPVSASWAEHRSSSKNVGSAAALLLCLLSFFA